MDTDLVLVIDADEMESHRLSRTFERAGFSVVEAAGSVEGLFQVLESAPDLILLAEEMPPLTAADLLTLVRHLTDAPIIVIGGGPDPEEVVALGEGADYYLRRPGSGAVLLAYAKAVLRRYPGSRGAQGSERTLGLHDRLTPTERRLLVCLAAHYSRPVAPQQLIAEAWDGDATPGSVKFYVWRLRQKLQGSDLRIQSLPALGYRLVKEGAGAAPGKAAV